MANKADAKGILSIYKPIVEVSSISFELESPSEAEMARRIEKIQNSHVWFVAESQGKIIAYAYGSEHRSRKAYQGATETSVYVHPDYKGKGIASKLYTVLLEILSLQGYTKALGIITLPNTPSCKLHSKMGFKELVQFENIGFKFNKWYSTIWYEKKLITNSLMDELNIHNLESLVHHPKLAKLMEKNFQFNS